MKIQHTFHAAMLLTSIFFLSLCSCKKSDAPATVPREENQELPGMVTGTGTPNGPAISTVIGPNGGTFITGDGALKIDVPAGAFSSDQTVSIQPITNLNKAGVGAAYRLTPHNITFNKAVTLTFRYDDSLIKNSTATALGVSYQNDQGIWYGSGNFIRDTSNKTIAVKTTHFSDWTFFQMLRILPWQSFIDPGKSLELKVMKMININGPFSGNVVEIADYPIIDSTASVVKDWSTSGGGFTIGAGGSATYYAPAGMPEKNPVVITAHVEAKGSEQWQLVAFVYVGKEGINYKMDNGDWVNAPVPLGAKKVNDTLRLIQGVPIINNQPAGSMSISWLGDHYNKSMKWTNKFPAFQYGTGGNTSYFQFKSEGSNISISPGSLNIMENNSEWITGSFLLTRAGKLIATVPTPQWHSTRFEGFFRVRWQQ